MNKLVLSMAAFTLLTACKAENPALMGPGRKPTPVSYAQPKPDPKSFDKEFKFANSEFTAEQGNYKQNEITLNFTVKDKGGKSVNDLSEKDFNVTDSGVRVSPFELLRDKKDDQKIADIAFIVDITKSMGPFIEAAKLRLKEFISTTAKKGYHIRMCLSAFGDGVEKRCDRFYDNTRPEQVSEFIHQLSQLRAWDDKKDPDLDENPMRALTESVAAPWEQTSQRFVILVTDADFYSPDKPEANKHFNYHQSNPDTAAPTMKQVTQAIADVQMSVFAITRPYPGFNTEFAGQPGISQKNGTNDGEWFDFDRVLQGKDKLDTILDHILRKIHTTYTLKYTVEKVQGLSPTTPLNQRQFQITGPGTVEITGKSSTMENGRPEYQKNWKMSDKNVQRDNIKVFLNEKPVPDSLYDIVGGEIRFKKVPSPGSKIRVSYLYEDIRQNFRLEPMVIPGKADSRTTKVYLNGKEARQSDISFDANMDGNTSLNLRPTALDSNDPYEIRRNNGLRIQVITNYSL